MDAARVAATGVRSRLVARLRAVRPPLADRSPTTRACEPFETDAFIAHRETPMLAVLPATRAQVRAVVRVCRELGVPVVSRGAGTGISGGAIPRSDGVLLVLSQHEAHPRRSTRARAPPWWSPA